MANEHVISALVKKRAELSGLLDSLDRQIEQYMLDLAHIDATLEMFGGDPTGIAPKRMYRRAAYFRPGELTRVCMTTLRTATDAISITEIAEAVLIEKQISDDDARAKIGVYRRVNTIVQALKRRGLIERVGETRAAKWRIVEDDRPE